MPIALSDTVVRLSDTPNAPTEIVVVEPGIVKLYEMAPLFMDSEAAEVIIAAFHDQDEELPIDWEHAAVTKASKGEPAPAAGWINDLHWDEERGLIASVEWTKKGKEMIVNKEYKYLSPVIFVDENSRKPVELHSVALTNKPRIKGQTELLEAIAASVVLPLLTRENDLMKVVKKGDGLPPKWMQRVQDGKLKKVKLSVESDPDKEALQAEEGDEAASAELAEIKSLVDAFKELLIAYDVEISDEASAIDVLNAVGELLMRLYEETANATDAAPVEDIAAEVSDVTASASDDEAEKLSQSEMHRQVCEKLGVDPKTPAKKVLAFITALQGHVGYTKTEKFNVLAGRLAKIEKKENEKEADSLVGQLVAQQKLSAYDEEKLVWARKLARTDPEHLKMVMAHAPKIVPAGNMMVSGIPDGDNKPSSKRKELILSASDEFNSAGAANRMCTRPTWVDMELQRVGQPGLNDTERKELS